MVNTSDKAEHKDISPLFITSFIMNVESLEGRLTTMSTSITVRPYIFGFVSLRLCLDISLRGQLFGASRRSWLRSLLETVYLTRFTACLSIELYVG